MLEHCFHAPEAAAGDDRVWRGAAVAGAASAAVQAMSSRASFIGISFKLAALCPSA
jgi:hypothetical protein